MLQRYWMDDGDPDSFRVGYFVRYDAALTMIRAAWDEAWKQSWDDASQEARVALREKWLRENVTWEVPR